MQDRIAPEIRRLPKRTLLEQLEQVELSVAKGTAQIEDYWVYIMCKEELARRGSGSCSRAPGVFG